MTDIPSQPPEVGSRLKGTLVNQQTIEQATVPYVPDAENMRIDSNVPATYVTDTPGEVHAQPESRLRSTFSSHEEVADETVEMPESKLKSTFNNLGNVGLSAAEIEPPLPEIGIGAIVTNRDSGLAYRIGGITETKHGQRANLLGPNGEKITLGLDDLKSKLATEGSPWHR